MPRGTGQGQPRMDKTWDPFSRVWRAESLWRREVEEIIDDNFGSRDRPMQSKTMVCCEFWQGEARSDDDGESGEGDCLRE
jgi:hypothetical protein